MPIRIKRFKTTVTVEYLEQGIQFGSAFVILSKKVDDVQAKKIAKILYPGAKISKMDVVRE